MNRFTTLISLLAVLMLPIVASAQEASIHGPSVVNARRSVTNALSSHVVSRLGFKFHVEAFDKNHKLVWTRDTHNMVTTQGANTYISSTLLNGIPVSGESEGNTGGSGTATTITLLQNQTATGQVSTIIPNSMTSLVIASYSGTFKDNGAGGVTCTGTCTNFTSGTINYNSGLVTMNCSSSCPSSGHAGTATYSYIPASWFVSLFYGASPPTFAITDTLSTWSGVEVSGTQVTNSTRPALVLSAASAGSTNNSGSVAVFTGNATVTLQGLLVTNSNVLAGTTYGQLLGEATFTAAPIASGYTINVTATVTSTAG